ncbi:MAG: GntR family transcriptional regulator [Anaerolineae bacterium]
MSSSRPVPIDLSQAVDRSSPVPYYHQLYEYLASLIQTGVLKPGDQIPTELEICQMTGLSRTVVRQAIHDLVNEGYLERFRAKGTFVARPKLPERLVQSIAGFYEDSMARGQVPVTQVLDFDVRPAPAQVAQKLQIGVGEPVIYLNRLRFIEGEPIVLVATYIPRVLCPDLIQEDMRTQSLYRVLESRYGLVIVRARRSLEAVAATAEEARLLQIEKGAPLLLLRSVGYLEDGRPLEYYVARHRGDRARFDVELVRPESDRS